MMAIWIILGTIIALLSPVKASASSETHISVSSTTHESNSTNIRIETNGEVKEYHSDSGDDVTITSENGKNSVSVTHDGKDPIRPIHPTSTIRPTRNIQPTTSPHASASPSIHTTIQVREEQHYRLQSFFRWIRSFF